MTDHDAILELHRKLRVARKNARKKLLTEREMRTALNVRWGEAIARANRAELKHTRLNDGLSNIAAYASGLAPKVHNIDVRVGGVQLASFFAALRDYAKEVRDGTQEPNRSRTYGTDLVSAARRWGIDFTTRA